MGNSIFSNRKRTVPKLQRKLEHIKLCLKQFEEKVKKNRAKAKRARAARRINRK